MTVGELIRELAEVDPTLHVEMEVDLRGIDIDLKSYGAIQLYGKSIKPVGGVDTVTDEKGTKALIHDFKE